VISQNNFINSNDSSLINSNVLNNFFDKYLVCIKNLESTFVDSIIKNIVSKIIYFCKFIGSEIFNKKIILCDGETEKLLKNSKPIEEYTNMIDRFANVFLQFFSNNQFKIICIIGCSVGLLCLYSITKIILLKYFQNIVYNNKVLK